MYWFFVITFFFNFLYHYFSQQNVLTQWAQPSLQYPRSYHHFIFYRYQFDVCLFSNVCQEYVFLVFVFFSTFIWFFFGAQTCVDSVGATIFTFPVVIQLNVFIAVPNHFVFFGKAKFSFTSFNLKEAMRLSSTHVMKMTWKQNQQSQKAFRRQNVQYSRKICLRLIVFVLNQVRVFVSGAYRHTQHAQTWLFTQKIISEEKIISSTLDKYCAFIIVNFICISTSAQIANRLRADSLSLNGILVVRKKTNTAYFCPLRKAEVSISTRL